MISRTLMSAALVAVCSTVSSQGHTQQSQAEARAVNEGQHMEKRRTDRIDPQEFVQTALEKGVAEIELAHVAIDKGSTPVKEFAQKMINDHRAANLKLKSIAEEHDIAVSDDATLLDKARKINLEIYSDSSFDKAYADNQVRAHEEAIELFGRAANSGHKELSTFAQDTLPTLKQHLEMARELQRTLADAD